MSLSQIISQACVLHRAALDANGYPVDGGEDVYTRCSLQQASRDEPEDLGETSDSTWRLFLPAGTECSTGDRVTVDGDDYELVGAPWHVQDPWAGAESHIEASARRTT